MNLLGIGLDYLMLKKDKVRGDVHGRQFDYAKNLNSLTLVVYSPKELSLKSEKWADNLWIYPTNSKSKATFVFDALRIASRICRERKIDVITTEDPFTTGFVGYLLKRKFGIPLNVQVHIDFCDNQYWIALRKINRVFNGLAKFILRRADTIRVGTNFEKEKLSMALRIPEERISVIPVNSDLDKFRDVDGYPVRREYLNGKFDRLILFTGRLVVQKDIPTLLQAFRLVIENRPSTLLLIVGKGPQDKFLKDLSIKLGINNNVIYTGSVEHSKMPQFLSACDVYAVSSIFEGTCIAMAEAMAAAKPVVVTQFAGAQDLISDGENGFMVEQRDYKTMAEKIIYLLDNPEKSQEMGRKGSSRIEEFFSNNRNIEAVIRLWEKTASIRR